jgi:uncharacterized protein
MGLTAVMLFAVAKAWLYFGEFRLSPLRYQPIDFAYGIAVGLGIVGLSAIVYRFWGSYRQSAHTYLRLVIEPLALPDILWLGLLPGLSEELLFRGVMLPAIGLDPIGIIISAACFGALHIGNHQWFPYAAWAAGVGAILGFTYVETGNLLIPIVAHIVTNWLSGLIWKLDLLPRID